MKILGICGSLRRESWNRKLLAAARSLLPADWHYQELDIGALPHLNEDLEESGWPDGVGEARDLVKAANGILIATPEYNYSIPAPLKNAVDWLSRPEAAAFGLHLAAGPEDFRNALLGKKVGIIGASMSKWGTVRAQLALRTALQLPQAQTMLAPEVFIASAHERFDHEGRISDPQTQEAVAMFMTAFRTYVAGQTHAPAIAA